MSCSAVQWGDVATWTGAVGSVVSAVAMITAAIFAWKAWQAQDDANKHAEREAAVKRVGDAVRDLSTGPVADARDKVETWTQGQPEDPILNVDFENVRHQAFVLLWALHRLTPLAADLKRADDAHGNVLGDHVRLIVKNLNAFEKKLQPEQQAMFTKSAKSARNALEVVLGAMGMESAEVELFPEIGQDDDEPQGEQPGEEEQ